MGKSKAKQLKIRNAAALGFRTATEGARHRLARTKKRTPQSSLDSAAGKDVHEPEKVIAQRTAKGGVTQFHSGSALARCTATSASH